MRTARKLPAKPEKILVIDLAMIGDLLCATPALAALRAAYPSASISLMASDSSASILKYVPEIDEFFAIKKQAVFRSLVEFVAAVRMLAERKFGVVFLFHNSIGSALLARFAGIRHRVGYATELRGTLLTFPVALPLEKMHLVEQRLNLLRKVGLSAELQPPRLSVDKEKALEIIARLLPDLNRDKPVLGVAVGSTWQTKIWPSGKIKAFLEKLPVGSCSVVLLGGPGEEYLTEGLNIISVPVHNLVGKTTLDELTNMIAGCDVLVTPDNGPMHIAESLNKPVIALFGPTDPKLSGMLHEHGVHIQADTPCLCCLEKKCTYNKFCMDLIDEEAVCSKVLEMLKEKGR